MNRLITVVSGLTLTVFAIAGFVDTVRQDDTGLAVLFGLLALGVAGLTVGQARRRTVVLRRDLASWVERTSAVTGETADELTNRAVSRLWASVSASSGSRRRAASRDRRASRRRAARASTGRCRDRGIVRRRQGCGARSAGGARRARPAVGRGDHGVVPAVRRGSDHRGAARRAPHHAGPGAERARRAPGAHRRGLPVGTTPARRWARPWTHSPRRSPAAGWSRCGPRRPPKTRRPRRSPGSTSRTSTSIRATCTTRCVASGRRCGTRRPAPIDASAPSTTPRWRWRWSSCGWWRPASAGVLFTVDPGGRPDAVRLEVVDGLGEQLVSGAVTPEAHVVDRDDMVASFAAIAPPLAGLAREALRLEEALGGPQDIEFADRGRGPLPRPGPSDHDHDRDRDGRRLRRLVRSAHDVHDGRHRRDAAGRAVAAVVERERPSGGERLPLPVRPARRRRGRR